MTEQPTVRVEQSDPMEQLRACLASIDGRYAFDDDKRVDTRHFGPPDNFNDFVPLTWGDLRRLASASPAETVLNPERADANFYVRLTDDGQHIRQWDRKPFEGATSYTRSDFAPFGLFSGKRPRAWGEYALVPRDDDALDFADTLLPDAMVDAGMDAIEFSRAESDIDWDDGMVAVAVFRAMLAAALARDGKVRS